jgi:hypothetical protein
MLTLKIPGCTSTGQLPMFPWTFEMNPCSFGGGALIDIFGICEGRFESLPPSAYLPGYLLNFADHLSSHSAWMNSTPLSHSH